MYRTLLWTALLALLAAIYAFSAQPGPQSDGLSAAAVSPLVELLTQLQEGGADTEAMLYAMLGRIVRKMAHLLEYALLGGLIYLLLASYGKQRLWLAVALAAIWAVTDELHQLFVPGRLGAVTDVLIDALGAWIGVTAANLLSRRRGKSAGE